DRHAAGVDLEINGPGVDCGGIERLGELAPDRRVDRHRVRARGRRHRGDETGWRWWRWRDRPAAVLRAASRLDDRERAHHRCMTEPRPQRHRITTNRPVDCPSSESTVNT